MAISSEIRSSGGVGRQSVRHGRAFLIEALAVLAFLMASLAVFAQLFAGAEIEALKANRLSRATTMASNYAEEFSADPMAAPTSVTEDELTLTCEIKPVQRDAGTLYEATITVADEGGNDLYVLETSRYVTDAGGGEAS